LGATVIEKHFTLDKTLPGNDHYHAMDPADIRTLLAGIEMTDSIRGSGELVHLKEESAARQNARRSLVSATMIKKGEQITQAQLTFKRPGSGISPAEIDAVTGCVATTDIAADTVLDWSMFEPSLPDRN
jgi:N-acetylneuraminate synthase